MKKLVLLLILTLTTNLKAETNLLKSENWAVYGSYSSFDTWLPGKFGIAASYEEFEGRTIEFGYQRGSYSFDFVIDGLGNITDQRLNLLSRSFLWDSSFNIHYGISYNQVDIYLGNLYTKIAGASFDLLVIKNLSVLWGFGNRWALSNQLTIGFDWFRIFYPIINIDQDTPFLNHAASGPEKDDVEKIVDAVSKLPTFSIAVLEIGYQF